MKRARFVSELQAGHKGPAVLVPFDPSEIWDIAPVPVESAVYGVRPGHPVRGTMNGVKFDGWIGRRWGRFFILVDRDLQRAARMRVGDPVEITVSPASSRPKPKSRRPGRALRGRRAGGDR